jgi:hypothetical protein
MTDTKKKTLLMFTAASAGGLGFLVGHQSGFTSVSSVQACSYEASPSSNDYCYCNFGFSEYCSSESTPTGSSCQNQGDC